MRRPSVIFTLLLLLVSTPVRADAGGGDAPGAWDAAVDAPLGTHEGVLDGYDADWYRIVHPAGKGVRIDFETDGPHEIFLTLRADDGQILETRFLEPSADGTLLDGGGGAVRFGVSPWAPSGATQAYTFTASEVALADAAVERLEVKAVQDEIGGVGFAHPTRRVVEVDLANHGPVPGEGRLWVTARAPTDHSWERIAFLEFDLAASETLAYVFEWDATGVVGDVIVEAFIAPEHDLDRSNNHLVSWHHVLLDGGRRGVMPVGGTSGACTPLYYGVCALVESDDSPFVSVHESGILHFVWLEAGYEEETVSLYTVLLLGLLVEADGSVDAGGAQLQACVLLFGWTCAGV